MGGRGQQGARATCCVRTHKQRDGTVMSKLGHDDAWALELSTGYLIWCSTCYRRWERGTWRLFCGRAGWGPPEHGCIYEGRGPLWHSLSETLTKWEGHLGSSCVSSPVSTMRLALLALRLMCLAWLWPVTQLNSSTFPKKRRHKELHVGENTKLKHGDTKLKHGGWAREYFLDDFFYWLYWWDAIL